MYSFTHVPCYAFSVLTRNALLTHSITSFFARQIRTEICCIEHVTLTARAYIAWHMSRKTCFPPPCPARLEQILLRSLELYRKLAALTGAHDAGAKHFPFSGQAALTARQQLGKLGVYYLPSVQAGWEAACCNPFQAGQQQLMSLDTAQPARCKSPTGTELVRLCSVSLLDKSL